MLITSELTKECPMVVRALADGETVFAEKDDDAALLRLRAIAEGNHSGKREECYAVFANPLTLWLLQTSGMPDEIHKKIDLFATTINDLAAKTVFVRLPHSKYEFPPLDRYSITRDTEDTVHLVIAGSGDMAEAIAINAAMVAHYPNYCRDHRLRTRITVIDERAFWLRDNMLRKYKNLFDNSYYRSLNLDVPSPRCILHKPYYSSSREDFVDVEWEFVNASISQEAVRHKLTEWATSPLKQLTLALCHDDNEINVALSLSLPDEIYANGVTVLCHTRRSEILTLAKNDSRYSNLFPFGEEICDISTMKTLLRLAKRVNYVYSYFFSMPDGSPITVPMEMDEEEIQRQWDNVASLAKQYSSIYNALTLGTKMHSMGHIPRDWSTYYAVSMNEADILAEVEHNRWSVEELILGYRPVTDDEQNAVENDISLKRELRSRKVHYDLRAFSDLREDCTGKNVSVYDMALTRAIPLIIKSCITN